MDRQLRKYIEKRVVTIREVDMTTLRVVATDSYGTDVQVSMHLTDGGVASIPAVNEIWTVERNGNEWFLDKRSDDGTESTDLTTLNPGDRRVEASGDLYLNSTNTNVTSDTSVTVAAPTVTIAAPTVNINGTTTNITGFKQSAFTSFPTINGTTDLLWTYDTIPYPQIMLVGGTSPILRSLGLPRYAGQTVTITGFGNPIVVKHTLAGGTGQMFAMRDGLDFTIASGANTSITFAYDSTYWREINRNALPPSVPPSTTVTATTIAGLGTATDGKVGQLRMGSSPYEFEKVTYDATRSKWISDSKQFSLPIQGNLPYPLPGTTGAWINILYESAAVIAMPFVDANPRITAGLQPEIRMTADLDWGATGGATGVYLIPMMFSSADGAAPTSGGSTSFLGAQIGPWPGSATRQIRRSSWAGPDATMVTSQQYFEIGVAADVLYTGSGSINFRMIQFEFRWVG